MHGFAGNRRRGASISEVQIVTCWDAPNGSLYGRDCSSVLGQLGDRCIQIRYLLQLRRNVVGKEITQSRLEYLHIKEHAPQDAPIA